MCTGRSTSRDGVLGKHHDFCAELAGGVDDFAGFGVDQPHVLLDAWIVRPQALQVVIEVRQVDQHQRRPMFAQDFDRRIGDPAAAGDIGARPPELEQRKHAQPRLQTVSQLFRLTVAIEQLAAIGRVAGPRRERPIDRRVHVVPPEEFGGGVRRIAAAAGFVEPLSVHQAIRLPPEPDFRQVAEVPAVADDAVLARQQAGEQRRLGRAGHGRQDRPQRTCETVAGQGGNVGRVFSQHRVAQPHDVDHNQRLGHGECGQSSACPVIL